ncbi:MAG: hypothetical protein AB1571_04265 [Nanoarchaeota archaeon]
MDKKAQFDIGHEVITWFPRIFILSIVLLVLIVGIVFHTSREIKTTDFEGFLLSSYFLYSNCLAYNNQPGIIDMAKFNSECQLNHDTAAKLTLSYEGKEFTKLINKEMYEDKAALCINKKFSCYSKKEYVLAMDNKLKGATLVIDSITKNG